MNPPQITVELNEWQRRGPLDTPDLRHLFLADESVRKLACRGNHVWKSDCCELRTGLQIEASSFVGRILLGHIQVTVRPKMHQLRVMQWLRYGFALRQLGLYEQVGFGTEADVFPELIVRQLAAEAGELVARGLRRAYIRFEDELATPRGKIMLERLARQGGVTQATLPCVYNPRSEDSLLNQVLMAGLHIGARVTHDFGLRVTLRRLATILAGSITAIHLHRTILERAERAIDRLNQAYRPALTLIRLLVENEGVSLDAEGGMVQLPGFLFDMNRLFQAVLSRFLRENLPDYTIRDEYRLTDMMAYHPEHNPWHRMAPTPRPDYVVMKGSHVAALLDAKYMDLWGRRDVGRDVLYQLAMYALSQPTGTASTILYPTADLAAKEARIDIFEPAHGAKRAQVIARPVLLDQLNGLLGDSTGSAAIERASFARWLAFGAA